MLKICNITHSMRKYFVYKEVKLNILKFLINNFMEQEEIKQEIQKKDSPETKGCLLGALYLLIIFLLIAVWIALLLAPPFGTALAILILIVLGSLR